jgi:S1-C subfamily serine protease
VTSGIVSGLGRNHLGINTFENFVQTDAAINPGNSGGALVDAAGNLLGINTAIYTRSGGSMGIGFAIPASLARQVLDGIVKEGHVTRGWIGVEPQDLSPELAQTFGLPADAQGVVVTGVLHGSPAQAAGLLPGDVLTHVGTQAIRNTSELLTQIAALRPGVAVTLSLQRQGQPQQLGITPGLRPGKRENKD